MARSTPYRHRSTRLMGERKIKGTVFGQNAKFVFDNVELWYIYLKTNLAQPQSWQYYYFKHYLFILGQLLFIWIKNTMSTVLGLVTSLINYISAYVMVGWWMYECWSINDEYVLILASLVSARLCKRVFITAGKRFLISLHKIN